MTGWRTIEELDLMAYSNEDGGRGACFNGAGQLVFEARFTDQSSGVFMATVPEPAALWVLLVPMLGLRRGRRHRG